MEDDLGENEALLGEKNSTMFLFFVQFLCRFL